MQMKAAKTKVPIREKFMKKLCFMRLHPPAPHKLRNGLNRPMGKCSPLVLRNFPVDAD